MQLDKHQLERAAERGLLRPEQVVPLWHFLTAQEPSRGRFRLAHILYSLGGLLALGAMSLFMTLGWQHAGGWALVIIGLLYVMAALGLTEWLRARKLLVPAAACALLVVLLAPLIGYGLLHALGWWQSDQPYPALFGYGYGQPMVLELVTLAVGGIMLWRYRLPLLVLPLAVTLWYLTLDICAWLLDEHQEAQQWVSLWLGLLMTAAAIRIDLGNNRRDFAFWLYIWGGAAFWAGLSLIHLQDATPSPWYPLLNLLMILLGILLARHILVILGGIGIAWYLGYLAWDVLADSLLFPLALTIIGLAVMGLGLFWQRHRQTLTSRLQQSLPARLSTLLTDRLE